MTRLLALVLIGALLPAAPRYLPGIYCWPNQYGHFALYGAAVESCWVEWDAQY